MHQIINSYLRKLTNLTSRNRSIVLLRLYTQGFLDINDLDFLNNQPAFSIIEQLIARKKEIYLCRLLDSRDETSNKVSQKLKKLWRFDRFVFEERGAKDLCVAWPFANGRFADGTLVRAPLLFFPVSLEIVDNAWVLKPRTDEYCFLNQSLLLAYAHFNKLNLDEQLMEFNFEEFPSDSRAFRVALYELFKSSGIELNFNQQNFTDNLLPFTSFTKTEFEEHHATGAIKLFPEAVLGLFPQAGSYLVPDYLALLEDGSIDDVAAFFNKEKHALNHGPAASFDYINSVKEELNITPFKMDAFQENALKAIKSGNSMVVQGPPGTGKSQLICNLMADYAAQGKRVLLVCQKRAALDVVYQRLQEIGLDPFVALVHDFKNDRRELYQQILLQIESLEEYRHQNNSLDAIYLEREFLQASRRIDQITEELEEFKRSLFDEEECGISIKELYLTSYLNGPTINLKQEYKYFPWKEAQAFSKDLGRYHRYWKRLEGDDFLWKDRLSFKDYTITDVQAINKVLDDVQTYSEKIVKEVGNKLKTEVSFDDCEEFINHREDIERFITFLKDEAVYDFFRHMVNFRDIEKDDLWLANMERVVMDCFKNEGPEVIIEAQELGTFQEVLQQKIESRKNIFKWLSWHLFSKEKMQFQRVMRANGLPNTRDGFKILVEKTDNRLNLEHNLSKLRNYPWLKDIPESYSEVDFQAWFYYQRKALNAKQIFRQQRNFKEYFNIQQLSYAQLKKQLQQLIRIMDDLPVHRQRWQSYLLPKQISAIINSPDLLEPYKKLLQREFDNLCEYDRLHHQFTGQQQSVLDKLYESWDHNSDDAITELFENSIKLAWIDHIETKYPVLRMVSSLRLDELQKEYQDLIKQKLALSHETLLLRLRERVYSEVRYNRLNNMISYRDLKHQVSKKKRIWPIRKLLSQFHEELFKLVPCWLASPESVSAMTPMKQLFDLVIFDEASQCFAEKGIPAMYRGNQVVITGDSKQLSPNDLYQIRWQEEDPDNFDLEIDSLLDLACKYLDQVQLQGHYRSKSLDLINFSNRHFYGDRLRMLPDYQVINNGIPAITFSKVDGLWEKNINQNEALEVVILVEKLLREEPDKSVGIVTFNVQQQQYIMERLEERLAQAEIPFPPSLIVKNIENVQGDEKDIIIFSIGYAPDEKGKLSMNFGSLNIAGGENRLNVAVTRARERIYIISSIMPSDLKVETSKNPGPRLFREYLQYAWDVSQGEYQMVAPELQGQRNEWYLKTRLMDEMSHKPNLTFEQSLPFADLTVRDERDFLGLILTDDNLYHQSISVKDSHVYVPLILYAKGWRFQGIFSRQYWMNPQEVVEQMERFAVKEGSAKSTTK